MSAHKNDRPGIEELVQRARALIPVLRARAQHCEQLRRIPPETVKDFIAAGFHRIASPIRFGGFGYGLDVSAEVAMELGRGCGSSAWMATQWPGHNFMVGMYSERAQKEYWETTPDGVSSTGPFVPGVTLEPVEGGYRLTGRWHFSSGIDAADWLHTMTPTMLCLVPKAHFCIEDDWYVAGLKGSGSKSVIMENVFVPDYRTLPVEGMYLGTSPGAALYDSPYYRMPFATWAPVMLAAPIVGMGQGVLDAFEDRARTRIDGHTGTPAIERPGTQLRFAESAAEVDTARMIIRNLHRDMQAWGKAANPIALIERARARRDTAYAVRLCLQSANRLYESGDASGIFDSHAGQRLVRDMHAAALHISLTWDEPAMQYARVKWDLPPQTRLI